MQTIYVVTHPQAQHHVDDLVGGWFDSELSEHGRAEAVAIAEELAARIGDAPVAVLSSDLARARQAGQIVAGRLSAPIRLDPDLREKSYGEAEGRPKTWLQQRQIPLPDDGERLRHDEGIAGAETRMDLAVRAYAAMARLVAAPNPTQVVITHGGTATLLLAAWIEMPLEAAGRVQFGLSSGGITELRKNPRNHSHTIARLNDTAHLGSVAAPPGRG